MIPPADKGDPYERDPLWAKTVHQPTSNGAGEPVEKEPDRGGERDRRPAPPELRLQRVYEDRRRRAHPGRDQEREEHHRDHDPSVVEPLPQHSLQESPPQSPEGPLSCLR